MKAKDMKKLVLCLIAAAVLTGGAACGNDSNTEKDGGTSSQNTMDDDGVAGDADIILTPETKRYIQEDRSNQYILFGRDTDDLKLAAINIAELVVIGDEIKLNYFMMPDNKRLD